VAHGDGPEQIFVTLGYAGWAAGQIENELAQNAWLTVPADQEVMFALPCAERVPAAMHLLGVVTTL
jgi:putative transcriptional regulator